MCPSTCTVAQRSLESKLKLSSQGLHTGMPYSAFAQALRDPMVAGVFK